MQVPYNRVLLNLPFHLLWHCCNLLHLFICYNQSVYCYYFYFKQLSLNQLRIRKIKDFTVPSFIPSLTLFLSLWRSKFLTSIIIFLPPEELLLTFCAGQVFFYFPPFLFFLRKTSFHFYRIILPDIESGLVFLFFQHFKYFIPLSSCLHGFWQEVWYNSYACSLVRCSPHSVFLKDVAFVCGFLTLARGRLEWEECRSPVRIRCGKVFFLVELWRRL